MKEKKEKSSVKKPFYKKIWFWVIIVVILVAIVSRNGTQDGFKEGMDQATSNQATSNTATNNTATNNTTTNNTAVSTEKISSNAFMDDVKTVVQGAIDGEGESITDVVLEDGDLCISVDLSNADPFPLTIEDLAISRTSSITDAVLGLTEYDSQWNTITVDFGDIGKITNSKENIKENETGGRYFPSANFDLE